MRYWLVRDGTVSVEIAPDRRALTILSRGIPRMAIGDVVVFLEGDDPQGFRATATIARVLPIEGRDPEERRTTKVELEPAVELPEHLGLEIMRYSLTIVRNTKSPAVHFRRGYRLLPQADVETLKAGETFVARAGYFELLNALPPELRAAFEAQQVLARVGESKPATFEENLKRIYTFLDQRVFSVGRLLEAIDHVARDLALADSNGNALEHQFESDDEPVTGVANRTDELSAQVQRFSGLRQELFRSFLEGSVVVERDTILRVLDEIQIQERRSIEARFERVFARIQ